MNTAVMGQQVCMDGHPVAFWPAAALFEQMNPCKADCSYLGELAKLAKKNLVIID
jgi:hypothetical protein